MFEPAFLRDYSNRPYLLPSPVDDGAYLIFLQQVLIHKLLDMEDIGHVPPPLCSSMWYQYDQGRLKAWV
ncbi:hypothetical protein TNCT_182651 [Trichonephila clavata]|uniref:Uncharacterized protein n=1 Tax=Trichonephila clavata TaxID=2740835 RepID=A0A8X6G7L9_TRICU|nr:hypothetical protein TNCT_182651 [Trichonephila clavata]